MSNQYLTLLRSNVNYRRLFLASGVSLAGDWFNVIAVVTLLKEVNLHGASAIGAIFIIKQLPLLLVSPLAGVLADRFSRKTILIIADLARFFVVSALVLTPYFPSLWFVFGVLLLQACFSGFFEPARSAILPDVVKGVDLLNANALGAMLWSTTLIFGSALGGIVTEFMGWQAAILIDALSYAISAWAIWGIEYQNPRTFPAQSDKPGQHRSNAPFSIKADLRVLATYFRARSRVFVLSLIKGVYCIGGAMYLLLTVSGQDVYPLSGSGALGITILYLARGFGALTGPIVGRYLCGGDGRRMRQMIFFAFVQIAISYVAFGLSSNVAWACVAIFFGHAAGAIIWVFSTVLIQMEVDERVRGRVFGFELALFTLSSSLSTLFYGYAIDTGWFTARGACITMGLSWIVPALMWLAAMQLWTQKPVNNGKV